MSHLVVGVLIGCLCLSIGNDVTEVYNNTGCLFFSMLFLVFAVHMQTMLTFPLEVSVVLREHRNNWYSLEAYYLARTVAALLVQVIYSIIYCSIIYWMTGQPFVAYRFLSFVAIATLTALVAQSLGLFIAAASPSAEVATLTYTIITVLLIRYGFGEMIVSIYGMNRPDLESLALTGKSLSELVTPAIASMFQTPEEVLEFLRMKEAEVYVDYAGIGIIFLIASLATYLVLRYRVGLGR